MSSSILKKLAVDQDVWTLALERVRHTYELFDHVAVSFSGGKDSTVTLHVVLEVAAELGRLPVRVFFFDEEAIPFETIDYVRRVAGRDDVELEWYCLPVQHRNACSREHPWWWPWAPEDEARWCRPLPEEAITELAGFPVEPPEARLTMPDAAPLLFPPALGNCAMFMGIRAAESLTRQRAVSRRRLDNYIIPWTRNVWKSYPVYDWSTRDVWTAPAQFGWDYNRSYDVMEMCGMSHHDQRCAPPYGEEPMRGLWTFAHCFPDIWAPMSQRVPGAATAARYATTELYSYGKVDPPPSGVTWEDHVRKLVGQHPASERAQVAGRVREWIRWHYDATPDPILPTARHPVTGVSWQALAMIADRGDYKDRKQLQPGNDPATKERLARGYEAERAALQAEGRTRW